MSNADGTIGAAVLFEQPERTARIAKIAQRIGKYPITSCPTGKARLISWLEHVSAKVGRLCQRAQSVFSTKVRVHNRDAHRRPGRAAAERQLFEHRVPAPCRAGARRCFRRTRSPQQQFSPALCNPVIGEVTVTSSVPISAVYCSVSALSVSVRMRTKSLRSAPQSRRGLADGPAIRAADRMALRCGTRRMR